MDESLPTWESFVPLADGRPVLRGCTILEAQCRGSVLALKVFHREAGGGMSLWLFRGPNGVPLTQMAVQKEDAGIQLSADATLLARQVRRAKVEVRETGGTAVPRLVTYTGRFSAVLQFMLGDRWLMLTTARRQMFVLRWDRNSLEIIRQIRSNRDDYVGLRLKVEVLHLLKRKVSISELKLSCAVGTATSVPEWIKCDPQRFTAGATTSVARTGLPATTYDVTAVADRFGQVAIFNYKRELVCMFFAFRDHLSGWLPDGTCFGPASHSGRPPTPADLTQFGRALSAASDGRSD